MHMRMKDERLSPRVQHGEEADMGAKMLRIAGDRVQGLGDSAEEDVIDNGFVLEGNRGDGFGDGEHHVEVLGIEHFGFALVNPGGPGETLTLGTVAISAGVVPDAGVPAPVTLLGMSPKGGRSTLLDGDHDTPVSV